MRVIVGSEILACRHLQVCPLQVVHRLHPVSRHPPAQGAYLKFEIKKDSSSSVVSFASKFLR